MKLFFDTEFTGLHQNTTLISIGIIDSNGYTFYAEFNDYDKTQLDNWLNDNIISNLKYANETTKTTKTTGVKRTAISTEVYGDSKLIKKELEKWTSIYDSIELWSDCLSYDFTLFNNIWGTAFDIPNNIYYIPFDICTMFKLAGIDPDINREKFAKIKNKNEIEKHNSLWDAKVIKMCYDILQSKFKNEYDTTLKRKSTIESIVK